METWEFVLQMLVWIHERNGFTFVSNHAQFGFLVDPTGFSHARLHPDLFLHKGNPSLWREQYLHPDYQPTGLDVRLFFFEVMVFLSALRVWEFGFYFVARISGFHFAKADLCASWTSGQHVYGDPGYGGTALLGHLLVPARQRGILRRARG